MRDNRWLANRLSEICKNHFPDVPIENVILVRFGRASKTRFGSIIARKKGNYRQDVTYITINSLFKDEVVPEYVIDATLMHEFVHYTHGFHSPLQRRYKYPHKGGIVDREIRQRGGGAVLAQQNKWIKDEYRNFLRSKKLI